MKRIIHVDNSGFFRKFLRNFLQAEGFEVVGFDNTKEASLAIVSGIGDMVIMGLAFADTEGNDFLARIRDSFNGPVIVISSSVDEMMEAELIAQGATAAINKSDPSWRQNLKSYLSVLK